MKCQLRKWELLEELNNNIVEENVEFDTNIVEFKGLLNQMLKTKESEDFKVLSAQGQNEIMRGMLIMLKEKAMP